jgi:transposase
MAKKFRRWDVEQRWLLPPSVKELVPDDHPAHFVRDLVRNDLDLGAIVDCYAEERGQPPFHPVMMTALLLYAYTQGVYSSRRIAKACQERVDFMALTAMQEPDFRTVNLFRQRHLEALGGLFVQVLRLCRRAGLVRLGHVALDGSKFKANASKHAAMSYKRMREEEARLRAEVQSWLEQAEAVDEAEDAEHGADRRGDEMPRWVANKQKRLSKIRKAKAALEKEAAEAAKARDDGDEAKAVRVKAPDARPRETAQRNFTDPESKIMRAKGAFEQSYNCQAAVDADSQVIVARSVTNKQNDTHELPPMLGQIKANTGRQAKELSADVGYCSEDNLCEISRRRVRGYVATGRQTHGSPSATGQRTKGPRARAMAARLKRGGFRSRYRLRKQTVEPVFGQIKEARGFRGFLLRGLHKVQAEWSLVCAAHNLLKLMRATAAAPT